MEPINTDAYTLKRKDDNTIVRIDGFGVETDEPTQDYYTSQIALHQQVVANLKAQADKLALFEAQNPPIDLPDEVTEEPV